MAPKLLLVILMEFLISKVSSSYYQPYPASHYVIRGPRPSYYPSYNTQVTRSTYRSPAEVMTPLKRPSEYLQPIHQNAVEFSSQGVQRPVEFRPPMYPATLVNPTIQPAMSVQPTYQPAGGSVIPTAQSPIEYRQPAYHNVAQLPTTQPIEYRAPTYQKACQQSPELISPTFQIPTEDHQPVYQKAAEFIASQIPLEYQQHIRSSNPTIPQSIQTPLLTSSAIESLNALTLPKSECSPQLPTLTSEAIESIKSLGFHKSDCLSPRSSTDTLETNVLNNLAIALQLLILNNIINHPRESVGSKSNLSDSLLDILYSPELPVSNSYSLTSQSPCLMHNANFLVSSNFGDDGIMSKGMLGLGSLGSGFPSPRPGSNLMSPYDAIAAYSSSSSPFSESLFALKNNFQSPYAAIMAADNNKDLFSMSDLF